MATRGNSASRQIVHSRSPAMAASRDFEERYFEDPAYPPGLKGGDEVHGYGYFPDYFPVVQAQLAALAEISEAASLLDAGCGKGALAEYARRDLRLSVAGLDCSAYATRRARQRAAGAPTVRGDVAALPFLAGSFDLAWCNGVLQYLEAEAARLALRELARVARKAAFVSNIAACHRHGDWALHDPLTRLYLQPSEWQGLARGCGLAALALPFEGESAVLIAGRDRAQLGVMALRFVERSLELQRRLGGLARLPPTLDAFRRRASRFD